MKFNQELLEKNIGWMIVCIVLLVSVGGLVEIVPLYFQKSTTEPVAGVVPYTPLQLTGRDVYLREGCYNCHSQMIRPFRAETERYGHYSVAGEFVYDHPFQWGSKRTGPDLARVGGRYSDDWHRAHLNNPRDVVPGIEHAELLVARDGAGERRRHPGEDEGVDAASAFRTPRSRSPRPPEELKGKTEQDAVVAYLQNMGLAMKNVR